MNKEKILIIDDDIIDLKTMCVYLQPDYETITAKNGEEGIQLFKKYRPELVILDVNMPGLNGYETASRLRKTYSDNWIPIIFLSSIIDDENIAKGIEAGGDDYLTKPISKVRLKSKIKAMTRIRNMSKQLISIKQQYQDLSTLDDLTGLYNRLQFNNEIKKQMDCAKLNHTSLAFLFIDLDNFKSVNDHFGHTIGDLLLKVVAKRLKMTIRKSDFIARLGGDEFAIILNPIKNLSAVTLIASRIIDTLTAKYNLDGNIVHCSASIGIAFSKPNISIETLMKNADEAMYKVKISGGSNYMFYT